MGGDAGLEGGAGTNGTRGAGPGPDSAPDPDLHSNSISNSNSVLRVGVTGHVNLTPQTAELVAEQLRTTLDDLRGAPGSRAAVIGVSCLAPGADSVFAQVVLDMGGTLEVLVPSRDYRGSKLSAQDAACFDTLLQRAGAVWTGSFATAGPPAYAAANAELLRRIRLLLAVWDGTGDSGLGGTAETIRAAQSRDIPVTIVWPDGAQRS